MYYINKDRKYEAISHATRLYYQNSGFNVQPYPQGMRIVTGVGNYRDPDGFKSKAVEMDCDEQSTGKWLPNGTTHPGGCGTIQVTTRFPSCGWANQSLDSWDHFSHLTWPIYKGGGLTWDDYWAGMICPESHPIKYSMIQMVTTYYMKSTQSWRANDVNVVFSNGDATGNTLHGDFVAGWDMDLQANTIAECGYGNGVGDALEKCAPLAAEFKVKGGFECRYQGLIPNEEVGFNKPLDQLPGCNPLWTQDMGPEKPTDCPWYKGDPGWVTPNVAWSDKALPELVVPLAVDLAQNDMSRTALNALSPKVGLEPWFTSWSKAANFGVASSNTPAQASIDTANAWSDMTPPCIATLHQDKWENFPSTTQASDAPQPKNKVMPHCGAKRGGKETYAPSKPSADSGTGATSPNAPSNPAVPNVLLAPPTDNTGSGPGSQGSGQSPANDSSGSNAQPTRKPKQCKRRKRRL